MEYKTRVAAGNGSQDIIIEREFDLPVDWLFKAYEDPEIFEEWMDTKVMLMENKKYGCYAFQTSRNGVVVFSAYGTIHEFTPNRKIIRTFEMENTPFPVQLEFLYFEKLTEEKSLLRIQIIFQSAEFRTQLLKMPFAYGLNQAHDRLQQLINKKITL